MPLVNLNDILFIDHLPFLDLHGYDRQSAHVAILDFIRDHQKMKVPVVVIIHGIGSGVIRRETLDTLKNSKQVIEYKLAPYNEGCTLVSIKL